MNDAFSHGQIHSKIWLLEELEPHIINDGNKCDSKIHILGSWINILPFMMLVRQPHAYSAIRCYDIDEGATLFGKIITNAWSWDPAIVKTIYTDANMVVFSKHTHNIVINTSPEHIRDPQWFDHIPSGSIVCIQSSNVTIQEEPWLITNPHPDLPSFLSKYPLSKQLYHGTRHFIYPDLQYERYMLIGVK